MCKINNCIKKTMYKNKDLCQMHYMRKLRNGTFEKKKKWNVKRDINIRHITSNGYVLVYRPKHILARGTGYILEHREVLYNLIGEKTPNCALCNCKTTWEIYFFHVDHIDENKQNNNISNLRMLCNSCNVGRTKKNQALVKGHLSLFFNNKSLTPEEWGRDKASNVKGYTIRNRIKAGWTVKDAITKPSQKATRRNTGSI